MRLEELSGYRVSRSTVTKVDSMPGSAKTWNMGFTSEKTTDRFRDGGEKGA